MFNPFAAQPEDAAQGSAFSFYSDPLAAYTSQAHQAPQRAPGRGRGAPSAPTQQQQPAGPRPPAPNAPYPPAQHHQQLRHPSQAGHPGPHHHQHSHVQAPPGPFHPGAGRGSGGMSLHGPHPPPLHPLAQRHPSHQQHQQPHPNPHHPHHQPPPGAPHPAHHPAPGPHNFSARPQFSYQRAPSPAMPPPPSAPELPGHRTAKLANRHQASATSQPTSHRSRTHGP
ncbi:MAG: hypothetical protein WDW38_008441 [Sanguina aurantia]